MKRRSRIHHYFEENFRYHNPPNRAGSGPNIAGLRPEDFIAEPISRAEAAADLARAGADKFGNVHEGLQLIVRDSRGGFWRLTIQGNEGTPSAMGAEDHWVDPRIAAEARAQASESNPNATHATDASSALWVRIPEGQPGQDVMRSVSRLLSPTGSLSQDGLHALLNSPQFQALFQGGQLTHGAAQMFSTRQLVGILIPPSLLAAHPEAAKSLLIAQGLPPGLINNIPDRAIAGALQALLQTSAGAADNPLHFLQTVASALTLAGIPVQETQNLLMNLLQAAKQQGIAGGMTADQLQNLAGKMMAGNNPQLLGLNQMVQQNFGQGLTQIFSAFIRVFMGGAMMQSQQQMWPQAAPNDRMLAELGSLFGAFSGKDVNKKPEQRKGKKQGRKELRIDDPAFQRVERKEEFSDEPRQHQEEGLASIFINVDED